MRLRMEETYLLEVRPGCSYSQFSTRSIVYSSLLSPTQRGILRSIVMLPVIALFVSITRCTGTPLSAVWLSPIAPVAPIGQYQTRDGLAGSYHYAYTGPHNSKVETRLGGAVPGGYSYIDGNGILKRVTYTGDHVPNGYPIEGNNFRKNQENVNGDKSIVGSSKGEELNVDKTASDDYKNVESENKWQFVKEIENSEKLNDNNKKIAETMIENPFLISKINIADEYSKDMGTTTNKNLNNYVDMNNIDKSTIGNGRYSHYQSAGIPHYVFPIVPYRMMHSSVQHTQDSLGQYDYSYTGDTSAKTESRSLDGTTRGAYSYVDPNGVLQQVHYIADENGFRVAATNLPEAK